MLCFYCGACIHTEDSLFCYTIQFNRSVDMLSDAQRIRRIKLLVDNGCAHRVVIAQDIHLKHQLVSVMLNLLELLATYFSYSTGEVWGSWLCPHFEEHCLQDEGKGDFPRDSPDDPCGKPKEVANIYLEELHLHYSKYNSIF